MRDVPTLLEILKALIEIPQELVAPDELLALLVVVERDDPVEAVGQLGTVGRRSNQDDAHLLLPKGIPLLAQQVARHDATHAVTDKRDFRFVHHWRMARCTRG